MQKSRMIKLNIFVIMAMLIVNIFSSLLGMTTVAFAEETVYSDVMEDLQRDETFSIDDYPADSYDNSLQVIQIAESADKELFIYVYQPSGQEGDLRATSINISTDRPPSETDDELSFMNYSLEYLNSYYTLFKYKVQNFEVSDAETRYYNISAIYRAWDENLDDPTDNDNTISEKAFTVGKIFEVGIRDGEIYYDCFETEVIEISDMYVGLLRFWNGLNLIDNSTDSHYVAFSTDRQIDRLLEAEVIYSYQEKMSYSNAYGLDSGEILVSSGEDVTVELRYDKEVSNPGGLFAHSYTWNQIQSISDFIEEKDLTDDAVQNLDGKQWVLNFLVTDYNHTNPSLGSSNTYYTEVTDVAILRLKFETDGDVYNLGVVSNRQTGSGEPSNNQTSVFEKIWNAIAGWFNSLALILKILVCVVLALLAIVVLYFIFKFFAWLIEGINKLFKK